ncbi:MAG TPA: hypothetical protein VHN14_25040 [Kofleriaceae bacterium]|nr:hypothetical protein [Kofleriaceae bacterium]
MTVDAVLVELGAERGARRHAPRDLGRAPAAGVRWAGPPLALRIEPRQVAERRADVVEQGNPAGLGESTARW